MYVRNGYAKRAYMLGPLSLRLLSSSEAGDSPYTDWLDSKPSRSVVYVCFGSLAHVSDAQLDELALGLEASGMVFLWVERTDRWCPPERWHKCVGGRGMVVTAWAPQRAILGNRAVGALVTHCGWNSVLETMAVGVPVVTWPIVFEQFTLRGCSRRSCGSGSSCGQTGDGAGVRSTRHDEKEVMPAQDVARALTTFMKPGGTGDAARSRVMDLAAKVHAAMAEGRSSDRDLHRLIDNLMEAATAGSTTM
jgi:hypothetical protein